MTERLARVEEGPRGVAAARSRAWQGLACLLDYPDDCFVETLREGAAVEGLRKLVAMLAPDVAVATSWTRLACPETNDALASEYTRLFDTGLGGPPCPLYGGLYAADRAKVMEECVRFYNHFGLQPAESPRELPDQLLTELEFLHFLAFREMQALGEGQDPGPWRRAQRDFLQRHPARWVPRLHERLAGQNAMPFYAELVALLDALLGHELTRLLEEEGTAPAA